MRLTTKRLKKVKNEVRCRESRYERFKKEKQDTVKSKPPSMGDTDFIESVWSGDSVAFLFHALKKITNVPIAALRSVQFRDIQGDYLSIHTSLDDSGKLHALKSKHRQVVKLPVKLLRVIFIIRTKRLRAHNFVFADNFGKLRSLDSLEARVQDAKRIIKR